MILRGILMTVVLTSVSPFLSILLAHTGLSLLKILNILFLSVIKTIVLFGTLHVENMVSTVSISLSRLYLFSMIKIFTVQTFTLAQY